MLDGLGMPQTPSLNVLFIARLRGNTALAGALAAITANGGGTSAAPPPAAAHADLAHSLFEAALAGPALADASASAAHAAAPIALAAGYTPLWAAIHGHA